jgi:endonuclease/exonuclease/phosphatase family metal-dependent hydrolase
MSTIFTRAVRTALVVAAAVAASVGSAQAQTTLILDAPGTQVTDVMIQAGTSANTNFNKSDMVATRASANYDYLRRALIKFDTQNTIPEKSTIQSAVMTLTVKTGGADAARTITVFPVTSSFSQEQATWNSRAVGTAWTSAGADLGPSALAATVSNAAGTKVSFDLTALVRAAVSGKTSSRYTRVALADLGASTSDSYREYFSSKAADPSVRPVLTVVYGGTATTTTTTVVPMPTITPAACAVTLDKTGLSVGTTEANWNVNVTAASTCKWSATSDASWLVVKSTLPTTATGNGYAKVRAITNTESASKRTGHFYVNGVVYTVSQGGCGTTCTGVVAPPVVVVPPVITLPPPPPPAGGVTLKVLQYNLHHGGYGSDGVYSMDRIADWIVKSQADIVSMNEVEKNDGYSLNLDQSVLYKELMERRTGQPWYMVYVSAYGTGKGIGNVVLSKFPFIATASYQLTANRAAVDATVDVNGRTVNFTSVHMDNVSTTNRLTETAELLPWALGFAEDRIICGDWNAGPTTTEVGNMTKTYNESWRAAKALGTATGNGITHGSHQIDYIFYSKTASHLTLVSSQIYATADANGVTPSDHEPVLAVFTVQ